MSDKRLQDVIGNNQIFTYIMSAHDVPWAEDDTITGTLLDFEYIYNQSGEKIISPSVRKNLTDGVLETTEFRKLCDVVFMMYGKRWARLWEILTAEFNPLENYNMLEEKQIDYGKKSTLGGTDTLQHGEKHTLSGSDSLIHGEKHTLSGSDSLIHGEKHTLGGSDSLQHGEKHTLSGTDSDTDTRATENEVSGFNSSGYVDNNKSTNSGSLSTTYGKSDTASGTDQTTYGKTDTASGTDQTTYGKTDTASGTDQTTYGKTDTASGSDSTIYGRTDTASGTDTETLTRSGNIGITTSQQMAESSLTLWKWNFFYDIFRDVDSIFTIPIY